MDKKNHIIHGFKVTLGAQVIYMISSAFLMYILARLLNPDGYGALYWAIGILAVVQLFADVGLGKSAARYISEYGEKDPGQITYLLRSTITYKLIILTIVGGILLLLHEQLAILLGNAEAAPFLAAGVLYIIVNSFSSFAQVAFQGFNRLGYSASIPAISGFFRLIFAVALVLMGLGALGALFGYILGYAIAAVFGLTMLYYRFYRQYESADQYEDGLSRRLLKYSIPLTVTRSANVVDKQIDTVLIGVFLTPTAVAFYTLGKQISEFILTPASALGFTISPNFGEQKATDHLDQARRIYETSLTQTLVLYVPAAVGLILVAKPLIMLVFGPNYGGAVPVLQILAVFMISQAITSLTTDGLDYLGRARARAIAKGLTSAANFVLNLILIPRIGVVGAAIATVVTHSIYTCINVYIIHTEISLRLSKLARSLVSICGITAAMAAVVLFVLPLVSNLIMLVGAIGLGVLIWAILAVTSGLIDPRLLRSVIT